MTDMDWAAETVIEILNKWGTDDDIHLDKLCDALRKAKADGYKEGYEAAARNPKNAWAYGEAMKVQSAPKLDPPAS